MEYIIVIHLSAKYEGVIQPRSIKTTNLTLESGFSIDRKNVYFINGENNHFVTSETAYENFASYKIDAENLRRQIVDTINYTYIDSQYNNYFSINITNFNDLKFGSVSLCNVPQCAEFTINSTNSEFQYSGVFWFELFDDSEPSRVFKDGVELSNDNNNYDLGLTDYSEYFVPNSTYYYTDNTLGYITEILNNHYTFSTDSGIPGEIKDIHLEKSGNIYYPVIELTSTSTDNFARNYANRDTGDIFYDMNSLFPYGDGTFTYYLKTDDYNYGKPYLVINGFDLASGYNPLAHDFDLFFDGDYHDVKVNLGNLGEIKGN